MIINGTHLLAIIIGAVVGIVLYKFAKGIDNQVEVGAERMSHLLAPLPINVQ